MKGGDEFLEIFDVKIGKDSFNMYETPVCHTDYYLFPSVHLILILRPETNGANLRTTVNDRYTETCSVKIRSLRTMLGYFQHIMDGVT